MNKKKYLSPPIPFQGQKRYWHKHISEAVHKTPKNTVFVDLFGGSGIVSQIIKQERPGAKVIYNDFDGYRERLKLIPGTNKILDAITEMLASVPYSKRVPAEVKNNIIIYLEELEAWEDLDIITISSGVLFSGNYCQDLECLKKQTFYNRVVKTRYSAQGYLDGIDVVCMDYRQIAAKYKAEGGNILFIADPPYLTTEVGSYKMYWKLSDYLDILDVLDGESFLFFTSGKSQLVELSEWLGNKGLLDFFHGAKMHYKRSPINYENYNNEVMVEKMDFNSSIINRGGSPLIKTYISELLNK